MRMWEMLCSLVVIRMTNINIARLKCALAEFLKYVVIGKDNENANFN